MKKFIKIIFVLGIALVGYLALTREAVVVVEEVEQIPAGFKQYKSEEYKFKLLYPDFLKSSEFNEGGDSSTLVFEDTEGKRGFQIFVTPYAESRVTMERFKMDVPYSSMKELKDISIASTTAASFYTDHPLLGEMVEIWFVRNGFLYEVSTLKSLEVELNEIMKSWQFL